jgi:hypothetical protein
MLLKLAMMSPPATYFNTFKNYWTFNAAMALSVHLLRAHGLTPRHRASAANALANSELALTFSVKRRSTLPISSVMSSNPGRSSGLNASARRAMAWGANRLAFANV